MGPLIHLAGQQRGADEHAQQHRQKHQNVLRQHAEARIPLHEVGQLHRLGNLGLRGRLDGGLHLDSGNQKESTQEPDNNSRNRRLASMLSPRGPDHGCLSSMSSDSGSTLKPPEAGCNQGSGQPNEHGGFD
jgi:hypothetical protein